MRSRMPQLLTMCAAVGCAAFLSWLECGSRPRAQSYSCEKLQLGARRTVDLQNQGLIIDRDCGLRQPELKIAYQLCI